MNKVELELQLDKLRQRVEWRAEHKYEGYALAFLRAAELAGLQAQIYVLRSYLDSHETQTS